MTQKKKPGRVPLSPLHRFAAEAELGVAVELKKGIDCWGAVAFLHEDGAAQTYVSVGGSSRALVELLSTMVKEWAARVEEAVATDSNENGAKH